MTTRSVPARSFVAPRPSLRALVLLTILLVPPLLAVAVAAQEPTAPKVTLTPVEEVLAAGPGGRATFRFLLSHTSDLEQSFNLLAEGPSDALVFFLTGNGTATVPPRGTVEVALAVTPRESTAAGRYTLTLTASSATPGNPGAFAQVLLLAGPSSEPFPDSGKHAELPPPGTLEGEVSAQFVNTTVPAGADGLAAFRLLLHNPANATRYLLLNVTGASEGLSFTYSPAPILVLPPNTRGEAQLGVALPPGAANGSYGFTLETQVPLSHLWYTLSTLTGSVMVGEFAPGQAYPGYPVSPIFDANATVDLTVRIENETQQVEAGSPAPITVHLENHARTFERIRVEWVEETGTLQPFIRFQPELFVAPGGNGSIPLGIPTSPHTPNGTYAIRLTVSSATNASRFLQYHAAEVTVVNSTGAPPSPLFRPGATRPIEAREDPQALQLGLAPPAPVTLLPEGAAPRATDGRVVIPYRVRNDGAVEDTFSLEVVVSEPFADSLRSATVDPDRLVVPPGESRLVNVSLLSPSEDAVMPPNAVTLRARSKDPQYGPVAASVVLPVRFPEVAAPVAVSPEATAAPTEGGAGLAVAAGVGTVGFAGVAALLLRRENVRYLVTAPLVPLYTRLAKAEVLDHGTRDRILQAIKDNPGVNYSTLKKDMALNAGALVHHLRTLERHQLIVSRREGPYRRFYPVGKRLPDLSRPPLTPMQERILALVPPGGITQKLIAERAGLTQQGANYHVKGLERNGYVVIRFSKGEWRVHPVLALESADARVAPAANAEEPRGAARP